MRVQLNIQNLVVEHDASLVVSFVNSTMVVLLHLLMIADVVDLFGLILQIKFNLSTVTGNC